MRAYEFTRFGGPDVLRLTRRDEPSPAPGEVIIDTRAIGLNPIDLRQRSGTFRFVNPTQFPIVPGNECAGVVSSVGPEVSSVAVGDAVFARTDKARLGALAERVAIDASLVAPMPRSVDFTTAATVPLAGTTALQAVRDLLSVGAGERVLITGGSTMVGMFAIQLASLAGAKVITTASAAALPLLHRLGAHEVIDRRQQAVPDTTATFDKVLDTVGGPQLAALLRITTPGGRLVSVASTPTPGSVRHDYTMAAWRVVVLETALWTATHRVRRLARARDVTYAFLSMRPNGDDLRELSRHIDAGALETKVDSTYDFEHAADAFARVESRRAKGKVVVVVGQG